MDSVAQQLLDPAVWFSWMAFFGALYYLFSEYAADDEPLEARHRRVFCTCILPWRVVSAGGK